MKRTIMFVAAICIIMMSLNTMATAQVRPRSAGIGFRGTYFRMNHSKPEITVATKYGASEVNVGGGGGWIYFFSRIDNNSIMEFSLGAVGKAETVSNNIEGDEVDVEAMASILFGIRHELFSAYNYNAMRPYIAFGAGPYWLCDISVENDHWGQEEEVIVSSTLKPGGYAGGGLNFMLTSWFGLNFDVKYHFVNFNVNHDYSGWEYGIGFMFAWGDYRPRR